MTAMTHLSQFCSQLQSAAPAAAALATAVPAMPSASSLQAHQDKNPGAGCSGNAPANEGPAVLAAADSIADATGLAWASAVVSQPDRGVTGAVSQAVQSHHVSNFDQASESFALPPAEGKDVSSYLVMLLRLCCHSSLTVNNSA